MKTYGQYLSEAVRIFPESESEKAYTRALAMERRSKKAEKIILDSKNPYVAYDYALNVIHGRWPEAEKIIKKHAFLAAQYAMKVIQNRWREGEDVLIKFSANWKAYLSFLTSMDAMNGTDNIVQILKTWGPLDVVLKTLNEIGTNKNTQEYIIKLRPDLIGQIKDLYPSLAEKYQDELNQSGVDI